MIADRYGVFISYSRKDAALVQPLVDELRRRGYRPFFDSQEIMIGDDWKPRLKRSLRASRVLLLCWSANAQASEIVHFEYSAAEGLVKPVPTWLLDDTPLPPLHQSNWSRSTNVSAIADQVQDRLGWPLRRRRLVLAGIVFLLVLAVFWNYYRRWEMSGEVKDRVTAIPLDGVTVTVTTLDGHPLGEGETGKTGSPGHYAVSLPGPKPAFVRIELRKSEYDPEGPKRVPTARPYSDFLVKQSAASSSPSSP